MIRKASPAAFEAIAALTFGSEVFLDRQRAMGDPRESHSGVNPEAGRAPSSELEKRLPRYGLPYARNLTLTTSGNAALQMGLSSSGEGRRRERRHHSHRQAHNRNPSDDNVRKVRGSIRDRSPTRRALRPRALRVTRGRTSGGQEPSLDTASRAMTKSKSFAWVHLFDAGSRCLTREI
jgi:hypothetical protein